MVITLDYYQFVLKIGTARHFYLGIYNLGIYFGQQ